MQYGIGVLLLVACGVAHARGEPATQPVIRVYTDFAWEAVLSSPAFPGLAQQPKNVLLRYFTPKLASALVADSNCATVSREICRLDFVPLWGSQDPGAEDLFISLAGAHAVRVEYVYPLTRERIVLTFRVISSGAGWRIADITYPSGASLAKLLSGSRK